MSLSQEKLVYLAELCGQTERFEDMVHYVKQIVKYDSELSTIERNLFSIAYKNLINSKRTALRALENIEYKQKTQGGYCLYLISEYKNKVKEEIQNICSEVLNLIKTFILKNCMNAKSKVFFLKMQGDYYRFLSECSINESKSKFSQASDEAYQEAHAVVNKNMRKADPIKLGLALSFAVFRYEIFNDPITAYKIAKTAFEEGLEDIENLGEEEGRDSMLIMSLLRDNLSLWDSEADTEKETTKNE